jgi:hypothetical protein
MIVHFLCLCASTFVPYSVTSHSFVPTINSDGLNNWTTPANHTIVLAMSDSDAKKGEVESTFTQAAIYFYGKADFVILDRTSARAVGREREIELTSLLVYARSFFLGSYLLPASATGVLYLLDLLLNPLPAPLSNLTQLYAVLGNSPFAILTPPNLTRRAMSLQYRASGQMGYVDVVPVVPELLLAMGIDSRAIGLFRMEDMTVVQVDFDVDSLYDASFPVYRTLMKSDFQDSDNLTFALIASTLDNDHRDFLYDVGVRFPNVTVGWAGDDVRAWVEHVAHQKFTAGVEVAAFNFERGQHYNVSGFFTPELLRAPFVVSKWVAAATQLLTQIESGVIQPIILSEEEPVDNPGPVSKLVGKTYEKFVMDEDTDAIVLYKRQNCSHCDKFFPEFEAFAADCRDLPFLKFGYIDVSKNSADIAFPYMPGVPHVHIFPAKNKTGGDALRSSRDRDGLIRFIKRWGTNEIPFEVPPPDRKKVAMEIFQMLMSAKNMPETEQMKAMAYIQEMSALVGLNTTAPKDEL